MLAHFPRVEFLKAIKKILSCISVKCVIKKFQVVVVQSNQEIYFGPVPKTLLKIWLNPGLNLTIFRRTGPCWHFDARAELLFCFDTIEPFHMTSHSPCWLKRRPWWCSKSIWTLSLIAINLHSFWPSVWKCSFCSGWNFLFVKTETGKNPNRQMRRRYAFVDVDVPIEAVLHRRWCMLLSLLCFCSPFKQSVYPLR